MAMIRSNGKFRAPLHRVLTDPTKKRYSAPFFYNPGYNELIAPFGCNPSDDNENESNSKRFNPWLWGYFRALRFAGDLTDLGVEIQTSHFKVGSESSHILKQKEFLDIIDFEEPFNVEKYRHILESKDILWMIFWHCVMYIKDETSLSCNRRCVWGRVTKTYFADFSSESSWDFHHWKNILLGH